MAIILGLLLFGRRIRARFDSVALVAAEEPIIQDDEDTARNEALSDLDFQVRDAQSDDPDYALDADLGEGTGLNDSAEISVAQDFGFSTETDLDLELPEIIGQAALSNATDIMPTQRIDDPSILDEEVLPGGESTYNMSMIVDATKQNIGDDASTEKDLQAVPFDLVAATDDHDEFTLNEQISLEALEQDYQDEFTATQVANMEIEKAAAELALRLGEPPADETAEMPTADVEEDSVDEMAAEMPTSDDADETLDEKTAEMPEANDAAETSSEMTAQIPGAAQAENEEFSDLDNTGLNDELTAQLPAAEDDSTTEMEVETGHYKTQKS